MQVTAVSVSVPRTVEIHGRPLVTSIVHDTHPGPVFFGMGGPAGNATAVHTEEVLAMAAENYDYWTTRLSIPRSAWTDCFWGENLTIRGLNENSLRIGDRLRIGANTVFEVTSPRIPCFKLSWRLGQPEAFLRTIIESGLTGFYLRVLTPGEVRPGDVASLQATATDSISVGDLSRLLHDETADIERLRSTVAIPALGRQAASMLRHRITRLTDGARCRRGRWQGWREFVVTRIERETADVRSFTIEPKDGGALAEYRAGQFLAVRMKTPAEETLTRTWSLSDYEEDGRAYRITIRRAADGRGSVHMHDRIAVGDTLELKNPAGAFTLDRSTPFRIVLISAGIGVTPVLSMLKAHVRRDDPSPLLWIHSTRDGATHVLGREVDAIMGANPYFRSHVCFTAPRPQDRIGRHYHARGRLTPERFSELLGSSYKCRPFGREIELPGHAGLFYICGPESFERMVRQALTGLGVDATAIHSEHFHRIVDSSAPTVAGCEVRFVRSAQSATWRPEQDMSLLELAEAQGIEAPFGCRAGSCHTCETNLVSGTVSYMIEPLVAPSSGRVLLCCARPDSPMLELDL